ncbi:glucosamine-6-phosphate deaminase [Paludifilum halophilum]|uniref:Glucosamine-6-phosphate deaminase n=1 Tax=Paludifilum halophilum TaxID=1642702 RepID=A0A235B5W6_9BACL|nr:glucosamine-6-phosphate deaminase [Paludifilum halophilum]OYD07698.1 glucosamine-6-phosphate deaminase [Paludifilum halophilum]
MQILQARDYNEMSELAAKRVIDQIKSSPQTTLGLATGATPLGIYQRLVEDSRKNGTSYRQVSTFNLDEYVGLSPEHPNSYRYYMDQNLFSGLDIDKARTHLPDGMAEDLEQECIQYEEKLKKAGGIDIQLLGLGRNGHIGFNEPGTPFSSRTHVVELDDSTRQANRRFFDSLDEVPTRAITMGIASIMEAREILLLVSGDKKADILHRLLEEEVVESLPASVLKRHPQVTLIAEEPLLSGHKRVTCP